MYIKDDHAQVFFYISTVIIPQLEGKASAVAIQILHREMLLEHCNSAIPQSQFLQYSATEGDISGNFSNMKSAMSIQG
jgi:hypothetical protein